MAIEIIPPKEATSTTKQANASLLHDLPFSDRKGYDDAMRGFIATIPDATIDAADGHVVWTIKGYEVLKQDNAPDTANPSLWRQSQLNLNHGLFKVTDRVYQIRGFDISNMNIIEGDTGLIIIDPLVSTECARAALELYYQHRPRRAVVAVIYTHSHLDHFGGVKGIVSEEDVKAGKTQIIAPDDFLEHAVSENVYAGPAMTRRSQYMYGILLPRGERGQLDAGLGKGVSIGTVTLIAPTDSISKTGDRRVIDGVEMVFLMAPNTEAPAEMLIYFPQFKVLDAAEDATHTLHNLYTLRGAVVRDAKAWWKALNEAIELWGDKTDIMVAHHHWPTWGQQNVIALLKKERDLYKYIHDQTLRLANQGYTMLEISEMVKPPASLSKEWYNRGYYGSVNHDVKAVYQKYLGWYDSNPANLHQLPPVEASKRYVEYMGGPEAVLAKARQSFEKGEYRWVAQVMNHVVFAYPDNTEARNLEADALEQLGYRTENATWRNEFLMGAYELRNGVSAVIETMSTSPDALKALTLDQFFDFMGIQLNGPKAEGKAIALNWDFTDVDEQYAVELENSVLVYTPNKQLVNADVTITLTRATLDAISLQKTTFAEAVMSGTIKIDGSKGKLLELVSLFDSFDQKFNIVTP